MIAILLLCGSAVAAAANIEATPANYRDLVRRLKPGDTLRLAPGTYTGLDVVGLNGTPDDWIRITGPSDNKPAVILGKADRNTVEILNSSYVALEYLRIDSRGIPGAFGVSAKGLESNRTHHIRIAHSVFVGQNGGQQTVAISTKTPTWGWVVRENLIIGAGTGMYFGSSDGTQPFVDGLIENNIVRDTIGYNIEVKHQNSIPAVDGMPLGATSTIIRNNVFIKNDQPSPDGNRPNVLVGGAPAAGAGSLSGFEIYGNLFLRNHQEALLQATGRVSVHDNLFVDGPINYPAVVFRTQNGFPVKVVNFYNNTIFTNGKGVYFGQRALSGDAVSGNLIFSVVPISGWTINEGDNITDLPGYASKHVTLPSFDVATMDFTPLPGKCRGTPIDLKLMRHDTDYALDFDGLPKAAADGVVFRGAYAGARKNEGWILSDGRKRLWNESLDPRAILIAVEPSHLAAGGRHTVTLTGANFNESSKISAGEGITVENVKSEDSTTITAVLQVAANAKPGIRSIVMDNGSGNGNALDLRVTPRR